MSKSEENKKKEREIEIEFKSEEEDKENLEEILEEIDEEKLSEFIPRFEIESRSGTLGQVAIAPEIVTTGPIRRTPEFAGGRDGDDPFKYTISSSASSDEPKYMHAEHVSGQMERQNIMEAGRDKNIFMPSIPNQEALFQGASEISQRGFASSNVEKYATPERFDPSQAGRKGHFEEQKEMHKKYDPKLPRN